jgi:hypothetical protein
MNARVRAAEVVAEFINCDKATRDMARLLSKKSPRG